MTRRNPGGRPAGSSPHRDTDDPILQQAVRLIASGQARNPTGAFKKLVQDEDTVHIRRLQRRWRQVGERLSQQEHDVRSQERWEIDSEALRQSAPDLHARITKFATSVAGAQLLEQIAGRPLPPMAFGLVRLLELAQSNAPHGASAADFAFDQALEHWSRFGTVPDRAFLLRFAKLCESKADDELAEAGQ
ncbi:MAG: hypothetical protein WBA44_01450 [Mesorhizobium sp.]